MKLFLCCSSAIEVDIDIRRNTPVAGRIFQEKLLYAVNRYVLPDGLL